MPMTSESMTQDVNLIAYNDPAVVNWYSQADWILPCEIYVFQKYIEKAQVVFDLGVGGGRTTAFIAAACSRYIGGDYSQAMIDACRKRFPSLEFCCVDATDLARFDDSSFDVVVFSHNGIDYIPIDQARARCFSEVTRVLRPGGYFIFSSHNADFCGFGAIIKQWVYHIIHLQLRQSIFVLWRAIRSIGTSLALAQQRRHSDGPYHRTGYIWDYWREHVRIFVSTPESMSAEAGAAGLHLVEMISKFYPDAFPAYLTPYYYYAFRKSMNRM